jgi:hypothetical protein
VHHAHVAVRQAGADGEAKVSLLGLDAGDFEEAGGAERRIAVDEDDVDLVHAVLNLLEVVVRQDAAAGIDGGVLLFDGGRPWKRGGEPSPRLAKIGPRYSLTG